MLYKKYNYPDMKQFEHEYHHKLKNTTIDDTDLIESNRNIYDILSPFFEKERRRNEKEHVYNDIKYRLEIKMNKLKRREKSSIEFFKSLNAKQTRDFLIMREEFNKLFDEERYDEAYRIRRLFSNRLHHSRYCRS
jgi:hypothetical protein